MKTEKNFTTRRCSGWFINGADRHMFQSGDMLFVPAGVEHRFDEFTLTFAPGSCFIGRRVDRGGTEVEGLRTENKNMKTIIHQALIVDQFSKQVIAFSTAKPIADALAATRP